MYELSSLIKTERNVSTIKFKKCARNNWCTCMRCVFTADTSSPCGAGRFLNPGVYLTLVGGAPGMVGGALTWWEGPLTWWEGP